MKYISTTVTFLLLLCVGTVHSAGGELADFEFGNNPDETFNFEATACTFLRGIPALISGRRDGAAIESAVKIMFEEGRNALDANDQNFLENIIYEQKETLKGSKLEGVELLEHVLTGYLKAHGISAGLSLVAETEK